MCFCQNFLCCLHSSTRSGQIEQVYTTTHSYLCQISYANQKKTEIDYNMSSEGIAKSN